MLSKLTEGFSPRVSVMSIEHQPQQQVASHRNFIAWSTARPLGEGLAAADAHLAPFSAPISLPKHLLRTDANVQTVVAILQSHSGYMVLLVSRALLHVHYCYANAPHNRRKQTRRRLLKCSRPNANQLHTTRRK